MRENCEDIFGRKRRFGVMDTFAVLLEMPVRRRFATPLKVKGEKRRSIHEAEDFVVFSPPSIKEGRQRLIPEGGSTWLNSMHCSRDYLLD